MVEHRIENPSVSGSIPDFSTKSGRLTPVLENSDSQLLIEFSWLLSFLPGWLLSVGFFNQNKFYFMDILQNRDKFSQEYEKALKETLFPVDKINEDVIGVSFAVFNSKSIAARVQPRHIHDTPAQRAQR